MTLNYALSDIVLPPTSLVLLTLFALLLLKSRRRVAIGLIVLSQVGLLALSLPVVCNALARSLEPPPLEPEAARRAQAIVILGGLMTSMALNLLVLPTLALRFVRFKSRPDLSAQTSA